MSQKDTKIIFMGTPQFAATILEKMLAARYNVVLVFTQPDKKTGRDRKIGVSPVKLMAQKNDIDIFQPDSLKEKGIVESIAMKKPDLVVVAAYGKILPGAILEIPRYGSINVHASLLPKFRGASPIQNAILAGEKKTGVTLMLMREKLDAGEIITQEKIEISKKDDAETLTKKLSEIGANLLIETLPAWLSGNIKAAGQDEKEATFCRTVKKEDGKIDWKEPAEKIFRKYKAYQPWPGIFTTFKKRRLKLAEIAIDPQKNIREKPGKVIKYDQDIVAIAGKGLIVLKKVQFEGKKEMDVVEFLRGQKDFLGTVL